MGVLRERVAVANFPPSPCVVTTHFPRPPRVDANIADPEAAFLWVSSKEIGFFLVLKCMRTKKRRILYMPYAGLTVVNEKNTDT